MDRRCLEARRRCQQPFVTLIHDLANDVSLGDGGGFVRQHARQLVLVARRQNQAAVDRDEPARYGEGIDLRVADHEIIKLMLAFFRMAGEAMADFLRVLAYFRVRENDAGLADLGNETESCVIFIVERNGGVRRTSQFRQILPGAFDGLGHALRIGHAHAGAHDGSGQECGYGFQR